MDNKKGDDVTVHMVDKLSRIGDNHWQGFHHTKGEFIFYHPEFPYKGEGKLKLIVQPLHRLRFLCILLRTPSPPL